MCSSESAWSCSLSGCSSPERFVEASCPARCGWLLRTASAGFVPSFLSPGSWNWKCFCPAGLRVMKCKMPPAFRGCFACRGTGAVPLTDPLQTRWRRRRRTSSLWCQKYLSLCSDCCGADTAADSGAGAVRPGLFPNRRELNLGLPQSR